MGDRMKVWAVAGSLRTGSWNHQLLEAAAALAPDDVDVEISDLLDQVPMFNEDLVGNEPLVVRELRAEVAAADAVIIATPEYNGMVPGVLKNLLDWIAFPMGNCALSDKPVALMGASGSKLGTARAQSGLRQMFVFCGALLVPGPEVLVSAAHEAFDAEGCLRDAAYQERIAHVYRTLRRYAQLNRAEMRTNS